MSRQSDRFGALIDGEPSFFRFRSCRRRPILTIMGLDLGFSFNSILELNEKETNAGLSLVDKRLTGF